MRQLAVDMTSDVDGPCGRSTAAGAPQLGQVKPSHHSGWWSGSDVGTVLLLDSSTHRAGHLTRPLPSPRDLRDEPHDEDDGRADRENGQRNHEDDEQQEPRVLEMVDEPAQRVCSNPGPVRPLDRQRVVVGAPWQCGRPTCGGSDQDVLSNNYDRFGRSPLCNRARPRGIGRRSRAFPLAAWPPRRQRLAA